LRTAQATRKGDGPFNIWHWPREAQSSRAVYDPYQVNGMVVRSLVGTFHPPTYVHTGPVQYLEFEPVGCEASSSL